MTIPQSVVCNDVATRIHIREHHVVVILVATLVSIDEHQIELQIQAWHHLHRITDMHLDSVSVGRILEPRQGEVLLFVVHFHSMKHTTLFQSFCKTQTAITAVCAQLKNQLRANHRHKHLQEPSLQMTACHAPIQQMQVGSTVEPMQIIALLVDVVYDIIINGNPQILRFPSLLGKGVICTNRRFIFFFMIHLQSIYSPHSLDAGRFSSASIPNLYESRPNPHITPTQAHEIME